MAAVEVKVPDIGDFDEVAVIEVLVKVGDTVKAEQSLITVESDKASMEIPSSTAGVVKELKFAVGDKVYWNNTNRQATSTVGSNMPIGVALAAASNSMITVRVRLHGALGTV